MSTNEVIEQALSLKASDRYLPLELLHTSLDKPDPEIDQVWQEEVLRRVKAYDKDGWRQFQWKRRSGIYSRNCYRAPTSSPGLPGGSHSKST